MAYWTTEQDAELARLWSRDDISIEDIAFRLERSPEGVSKRAKRLVLPPRCVNTAHRSRRIVAASVDRDVLRALQAEIPDEDHRSLTGRFFGDPNPADMRRQA